MAGTHTKFKGVGHYAQTTLTNQIENNLISFFNNAILEIGGFTNVTIPSSGFYGNRHRLRYSNDVNYGSGRVWEGFRADWVWETGLDYRTQPIRVSGVFVNNTFHPTTGVGPYSHIVDYPNGRVIFTSGIAQNSVVHCNFSHRLVKFTNADAPWFRQIQLDSYRADHPHFLQAGSGVWDLLSQTRIQLPAVAVDSLSRLPSEGLELGGGQKVYHEVGCYVFAQNSVDRNKLMDYLLEQAEKSIQMYDVNDIPYHLFPLDNNGSPNPSGLMYPQLVEPSSNGGYLWRLCRFVNTQARKIDLVSPDIYGAEVRITLEVRMPEI